MKDSISTRISLSLIMDLWAILGTVAGWFVYGGFNGAVIGLSMTVTLGIVSAVGVFPIVGPIAYYLAAKYLLLPTIFILTGTQWNSLTSLVFTWFLTLSVYFTADSIVFFPFGTRRETEVE